MTIEENVAVETETAAQEPVQAQDTGVTQATEGNAELPVETNDSLNVDENPAQDGKTSEWYEQELTKRNAESKRRREKEKELKAENERLTSRLSDFESKAPTQDQFGDDYDGFQVAQQKHIAKVAAMEMAKEESDFQIESQFSPVDKANDEAINKANESYIENINTYFDNGGQVTPEAYSKKAGIVNASIVERSLDQQAMIINELSSLGGDTVNAMLSISSSPELQHKIAYGSMREALNAIHDSLKTVKTPSKAPEPVPEVEGSGGIAPVGDPSTMTMAQYKAWKSAKG